MRIIHLGTTWSGHCEVQVDPILSRDSFRTKSLRNCLGMEEDAVHSCYWWAMWLIGYHAELRDIGVITDKGVSGKLKIREYPNYDAKGEIMLWQVPMEYNLQVLVDKATNRTWITIDLWAQFSVNQRWSGLIIYFLGPIWDLSGFYCIFNYICKVRCDKREDRVWLESQQVKIVVDRVINQSKD